MKKKYMIHLQLATHYKSKVSRCACQRQRSEEYANQNLSHHESYQLQEICRSYVAKSRTSFL